MTILYSFYTDEGILFGADSAVTIGRGNNTTIVRRDDKVLHLRRVGVHPEGGVLGYYGLATAGNQPMTAWLRSVMGHWHGSKSVEDFAVHLWEQLSQLRPRRRVVSGFHIGGYELRDRVRVPVFWHIWNYDGVDLTGYHGIRDDYHPPMEQLLGRELRGVAPRDVRGVLEAQQSDGGMPYWYRNGDLPFFLPITEALHRLVTYNTVSRPQLFHSPDDIAGWERLLGTMLRTVGGLYRALYQAGDPPISGPYRIISLARRG
jgi:hypothetical protein